MGRPANPQAKPVKRKDGTTVWRVRFRNHRNQHTSETFPTEMAAKVFIARMLDPNIGIERAIQLRNREDPNSASSIPTVRKALEYHVETLTGIDERTRADYIRIAERSWLPYLGDFRVDEVEDRDVARWLNAAAGTLAPKTIRNQHSVLSATMSTAVRKQWITFNPVKGMKVSRAGEEDESDPKFLSHAEFDIFYPCFSERWQPLIVWMFGMGTRFSETTAGQVRDLDLRAGHWDGDIWESAPTMKVVRAWRRSPRRLGPPKAKASRRTIVMPEEVVEVIEPLLPTRQPEAFIFRTASGTALTHGNFFNRVWKPATLKATICPEHREPKCRCLAGKPELCTVHTARDGQGHVILQEGCGCAGTLSFRPRIHDARHTHASWLIAAGERLDVIQKRLGHEDYLTTQRLYGHLMPNALRDAGRSASLAFKATSLGRAAAPRELT
jgi:integrase